MVKEVVWTAQAIEDLKDIFEYEESGSQAEAKIRIFLKSVEKLKDFPKLGQVVPELDHLSYFEISVGNRRAIFKEIDGKVVILTVTHTRPRYRA